MPFRFIILVIIGSLLFISNTQAAQLGPVPDQLPVKNMVTMIDLGANKCIPCKMMAPILKELKTEYQGRAAIVFIDVWENKSMAEKFKIRSIPTQIFYDREGNEIFRHEGFFDKQSIMAKLDEIGEGAGGGQRPLTIDDLPVKSKATLIMIDNNPAQKQNKTMDWLNEIQSAFPEQLVVVFLDLKDIPAAGKKFQAHAVPSLLFFDRTGREIHRTQEMLSPDQVAAVFEKAGEKLNAGERPGFPAKGMAGLLCLGDQSVVPKEQILPSLTELLGQYAGRLEVVYADHREFPDLASRYKVSQYPAYILFNDRGQEIHRQYGMMTNRDVMARFGAIGLKPLKE